MTTIGFGCAATACRTDVEFLDHAPVDMAKAGTHGDTPSSALDSATEKFLPFDTDSLSELNWTADVASHMMVGVAY